LSLVVAGRGRLWYRPNMKPREFLQVDPASLHLPSSRRDGADPVKLQRQTAKYGSSIDGMPPPEVKRGSDGNLVIYDGVTRATRAAKSLPGTQITVEVTGTLTKPVGSLPTVGEKL
jgi:hypothetical protein